MKAFLRKLFDPSCFIEPSQIQGGLVSIREGYGRCVNVAWPATVESLLNVMLGFVDTIMVGVLGDRAISAVGVTTQPKYLMLMFLLSLNVGVTAIVARRKGEGDIKGCCRSLKQSLMVSAILSVLVLVGSYFFATELLALAGAQSDYLADSVTYFRIVMIGQFFGCLGMTINAAQRGYGNTKVPMISNILANIVNLGLNYLLINGIWFFPRLGVIGSAVSTAVSTLVIFLLALYSVTSNRSRGGLSIVGPASGTWRFEKNTLKSVNKVASSALVEQAFMRFGFFTYASMVARLGTMPFATHQICMNIINISFAVSDGFGVAATSLVGQALGAKRSDLARVYGTIAQRCSMVFGLVLCGLFLLLRSQLIMLFTDEQEIIRMGAQIMLIIAATSLAQTSQVVISGCLRGAGDTRFVAISSLLSVGAIRPGLSWLLCYPLGFGLIGAWLGLFADQLLRLLMNAARFKSGKWTRISL
ncbi:MAG: MATE family efflux transporter [Eubacteriales bacterium]|nr:MATE family efflux transporter [Eubacteriales bacterium]